MKLDAHARELLGTLSPEELCRIDAEVICDRLGFRSDSGEAQFLTRQLRYIRSKTYDVLRRPLKSRMFIPIGRDVPEWAETFSWYSWTQVGMAEIISDYTQALPQANAHAQELESKCRDIGAEYMYSMREIRSAAQGQSRLPMRKAMAAREAIELAIDQTLALGNSDFGLTGFLNAANVPDVSLPTGTWSTASSTQIYDDLTYFITSIEYASYERHMCTDVILDRASYRIVATKRMSSDNGETVLSAVRRAHPGVSIHQWSRCDLADSAGTGPKIVAYQKDPMVLEGIIPMEYEELPAQPNSLAFVVPAWARVGGTVVHYPLGMAYSDDV